VLSMIEIAEAVQSRKISAEEVMKDCLERIHDRNPEIGAFVYVDDDAAISQAKTVDIRLAAGEEIGPLAGVPIGVKDLFEDVKGMPVSQGSLYFKDGAAAEKDSVMVSRLRSAGAIPVGKVATAEFGVDGTGTTKAWGAVRNAWNLERSAGGSSGGSSAAVAAGMVSVCTGGDGGGSIRCPASFTGLVGFKPTLGRIPRQDGFSDTVGLGALTTTVADTARYIDVTAGPHDSDRMTLPRPQVVYEKEIERLDASGLKVVWADHFYGDVVDPEVAAIARAAAEKLVEDAGLDFVREGFSCVNATQAWTGIAANSMRNWFLADGFMPDRINELSRMPRWLIEAYRDQTSEDLHRHKVVLKTLEAQVAALFEEVDLLITPTMATTAFNFEGPLPDVTELLGTGANLLEMLVAAWSKHSPFCMLANFCWNPSISIPAGFTSEGMPVGLMVTARRHKDEIPLRLARIVEQTNPWPLRPEGY